jgi:cytidylate kinase
MSCEIVCLARTLGGGGEEVAHGVSKQLGFRYVDEEIIARAAAKENLDPRLIEDVEKRQSLITRLLESITTADVLEPIAHTPGWWDPEAYSTGLALALNSPEDRRGLIRDAVRETADQGQVVIVAHAAAIALAGRANVLRVLVTASPETRARRIQGAGKLGAKAAAKAVKDSDGNRRDYFKRFYQVTEEPMHYDLVINTDQLTLGQAVDLVVGAARS